MRTPLRHAEGARLAASFKHLDLHPHPRSSNWVTCMRKSSELLHVNYMEMEAACDVEGAIVWQNAMQSNSYFVKRQLLQ